MNNLFYFGQMKQKDLACTLSSGLVIFNQDRYLFQIEYGINEWKNKIYSEKFFF